MSSTYVSVSLSAEDITTARHHVTHDEDTLRASYPTGAKFPAYIAGTPDELRAAAARLYNLADQQDGAS